MSYSQAQSKTPKRPFKGSNTLDLKSDYTVIDIETSSNGRKYGEVIEISAIKVRNNQIIDYFDSLVKPSSPIDAYTMSIHNITNKMVLDAPNIDSVYPKFRQFIGDDILIGHNVHFDINFLYDYHEELNQPPLSNDFIDTLRLARRTLPKMRSYSLSNLSQFFGYEATKHRALGDCENTHLIYQRMKDRLSPQELEFLKTLTIKQSNNSRTQVEHLVPLTRTYSKENFFYKKNVTFTGRLKSFSRKQAAQEVVNRRGVVSNQIHSNTNVLIVGRQNNFSKKYQTALHLKHVIILNEDEFIELLKTYEECS